MVIAYTLRIFVCTPLLDVIKSKDDQWVFSEEIFIKEIQVQTFKQL